MRRIERLQSDRVSTVGQNVRGDVHRHERRLDLQRLSGQRQFALAHGIAPDGDAQRIAT
jgi:hypothetical protein